MLYNGKEVLTQETFSYATVKIGDYVQQAVVDDAIASDWKNRGNRDYRKGREFQLQTAVGGKLNPMWVEWLMGFPIGWTDLEASGTP